MWMWIFWQVLRSTFSLPNLINDIYLRVNKSDLLWDLTFPQPLTSSTWFSSALSNLWKYIQVKARNVKKCCVSLSKNLFHYHHLINIFPDTGSFLSDNTDIWVIREKREKKSHGVSFAWCGWMMIWNGWMMIGQPPCDTILVLQNYITILFCI